MEFLSHAASPLNSGSFPLISTIKRNGTKFAYTSDLWQAEPTGETGNVSS